MTYKYFSFVSLGAQTISQPEDSEFVDYKIIDGYHVWIFRVDYSNQKPQDGQEISF